MCVPAISPADVSISPFKYVIPLEVISMVAPFPPVPAAVAGSPPVALISLTLTSPPPAVMATAAPFPPMLAAPPAALPDALIAPETVTPDAVE